MHVRFLLAPALIAIGGGCADPPVGRHRFAGAGGLPGSIFTTTEDGTRLDDDIFRHDCDVYLNTGTLFPGDPGLPEGDYYVQVTDPPGHALLSTDAVAARQFHIGATGQISGVSGAGSHDTGINLVEGGVTLQVCPFLTSSNPDCEYEVWITPVEFYSPGDGVHGFIPTASLFRRFKVCPLHDGGVEPPDDEDDPEQFEQG